MAKDYVRFLGHEFAAKGTGGLASSELFQVGDTTPEPEPRAQPAMAGPTFLSRQQLIELHGPAIGEALWLSVAAERQKVAEQFRVAHARLAEIRAEIATKQAQLEPRLQALQRAADKAYRTYIDSSAQIDGERAAFQSEIAPLNSEAEEIVRTLNVPMHAERVRQWATTTDARRLPGAES